MRSVLLVGLVLSWAAGLPISKAFADPPPLAPPPQTAPAPSPFRDLTPLSVPEDSMPKLDKPILAIHGSERETGFYGAAELLFWRPHLRDMDYGLVDANNDGTPAGQVVSLDYGDQVGFRTNVGYRLESGWDIDLGYTYFRSSASGQVAAAANGVVYTTFSRPAFVDQAALATSSAKLNYSMYDLIFGRTLALEENLNLRLFGGIRFADISQRQETFYDGLQADSARFVNAAKFNGAGPVVGLELEGKIVRSLSVFGKFSTGMILGDNKNSLSGYNNAGLTPDSAFIDNYRQVVPMVNVGIGMGYQYRWLSVRAGYEVTNWFGLVERAKYTGEIAEGRYTTHTSDLSLDGFNLQLGIRF